MKKRMQTGIYSGSNENLFTKSLFPSVYYKNQARSDDCWYDFHNHKIYLDLCFQL